MEVLNRIIQTELTPAQQDIVLCCMIQGMPQAAYARKKGVNKSTANRTLHRALRKIRKYAQYSEIAMTK